MITFQALCYVLKSYVPNTHEEAKNRTSSETNSTPTSEHPRKLVYKSILQGDPIVDNPILLASLLDGLAIMTEKFKLKWQECVETICVLSLAQEILKHPGILPMVCRCSQQKRRKPFRFIMANVLLLTKCSNST